MTTTELIRLLQQCKPDAQVALVDSTGIYELMGVQQTVNPEAVFLLHATSGFEAALR